MSVGMEQKAKHQVTKHQAEKQQEHIYKHETIQIRAYTIYTVVLKIITKKSY